MAPTSSCTDQAVVLETAEPDVQPEAVVQVGNLEIWWIRWLVVAYGACHCFHINRGWETQPNSRVYIPNIRIIH